MKEIIDDEGRIFGTINIIDAVVVLFVLAIFIAGIALVTSGGGGAPEPGNESEGPESRTITVEMQSIVSPAVTSELKEISRAPEFGISAVHDVRVQRSLVVNNTNYRDYTETRELITLEVSLLTTYQSGAYTYRGSRVYVGQQLELDFGRTIVSGEVVEITDQ